MPLSLLTIIKGSWEAIIQVTDDFYSMKGGVNEILDA